MMADQSGNGAGAVETNPEFSILAQYTKDLSFENPNAPRTLGPQQVAPNLSVQINVNARQLTASDFEVSLMLEGGAGEGSETMFKFELNYAGVVRVREFSTRAGAARGHDRRAAHVVSLRPADYR